MGNKKGLLLFAPDKCTGCRLCETVCALGHEGVVAPALSRISIIKDEAAGTDIPMYCQQCEKALCREVCPAGAMEMDSDLAITRINQERCIGCLMCVQACLFGGISITPGKKLSKCDLCGGAPKCVGYCPTGALAYLPEAKVASGRRRQSLRKLLDYYEKASSVEG